MKFYLGKNIDYKWIYIFLYYFEFNIYVYINYVFILIKDCGGLLELEFGDLVLFNWLRNYGYNFNCLWIIIVLKFKV